MPKIKNHYKTLGIATGASERDILKARNRLLRRHHPDMNQGREDEAKERTIDILMAADVLLDEGSRAEYDRLYYIHFGVAARKAAGAKKPAGDRPGTTSGENASAGKASSRTASAGGDRYKVVVCGYCGKRNVNPKNNYCMFCGTGIGDNPRSFSFDDVSDEIMNEYKRVWEKQSKSVFGEFSADLSSIFWNTVVLVVVLILILTVFKKFQFLASILYVLCIVGFIIWMAYKTRE